MRSSAAAPEASTPTTRRRMESQRSRDTGAEVQLRSLLHRRGLRFRKHVGVLPGVRREHDIVFGRSKVVVEVHGCWWHGCEVHYRPPKANAAWWEAKVQRNRERDADTRARLESAGWLVVTVWEHDDLDDAANRIQLLVDARRP
jgi:DNA mismatch endonuclease, patch repair protein